MDTVILQFENLASQLERPSPGEAIRTPSTQGDLGTAFLDVACANPDRAAFETKAGIYTYDWLHRIVAAP